MKPSSLSSPFRVGGRGSKQLSKAIETSNSEKEKAGLSATYDNTFALCTGSSLCFAKILSSPSPESVLIQPMHPTDMNTSLFVPREGLVWLAKKAILYPVSMKQELGGWRVRYTEQLCCLMRQAGINVEALQRPQQPHQPMSVAVASATKKDWDVVTLEGSDLEDCSSVDSLLFSRSHLPSQLMSEVPLAHSAPPISHPPSLNSTPTISTATPSPEATQHHRYRKLSVFQSPRRYDCSPVSAAAPPVNSGSSSNGWAKMHFGVPLSPPVSVSSQHSSPVSSDLQPDLSPPTLLTSLGPYPMTALHCEPSTLQREEKIIMTPSGADGFGSAAADVNIVAAGSASATANADNTPTSADDNDANAATENEEDMDDARSTDTWCQEDSKECCDDVADTQNGLSAFPDVITDDKMTITEDAATSNSVEEATQAHISTDDAPTSDSSIQHMHEPLSEESEVDSSAYMDSQAQEKYSISVHVVPDVITCNSGEITPRADIINEPNIDYSTPVSQEPETETSSPIAPAKEAIPVETISEAGEVAVKKGKRRRRSQLDVLFDSYTPTASPEKRVCGIANLPKVKLEKSPVRPSPSTDGYVTKPPLRTKRHSEEPARVLPSRSAREKSSNYLARDSFLGSWPSRNQAFATGTWEL